MFFNPLYTLLGNTVGKEKLRELSLAILVSSPLPVSVSNWPSSCIYWDEPHDNTPSKVGQIHTFPHTYFVVLLGANLKPSSPNSLPRKRALAGPIPRRRVPPTNERRPAATDRARHAHARRRRPDALRVVSVRPEIPLADLLPAVIARLVDPGLGGVGEGAAGAGPVEVLALVGPLVAGAVVQAAVGGGETVGPVLGVGGEVGGPG